MDSNVDFEQSTPDEKSTQNLENGLEKIEFKTSVSNSNTKCIIDKKKSKSLSKTTTKRRIRKNLQNIVIAIMKLLRHQYVKKLALNIKLVMKHF